MAMPIAELLFGGPPDGHDDGGKHRNRAEGQNAPAVQSADRLTDDAALVARVRQGDVVAIEEIFRAHYGALVQYARRFSGSADTAEDLAQDAFVQFFEQQRRGSSNLPQSVVALLRTIVRRHAVNEWKHLEITGRVHDTARAGNDALTTGQDAELPDTLVERAEAIAAVRCAFDTLPRRARVIATMRWSDGFGRQEIAAELGISVRTVDAQLYVVAGRIRESLEPFR